MAKNYLNVRIYGYNNTNELENQIAEFIANAQNKGVFAEIQYSINNGIVSALCMEYKEV
ncbi:MAG: hypothetical protein J6R67_03790 [Treponema sp.]|nr:hypothetical protein [Treponema sp.]